MVHIIYAGHLLHKHLFSKLIGTVASEEVKTICTTAFHNEHHKQGKNYCPECGCKLG